MYILKRLGDESENQKVLARLKKRIKRDVNCIRQVNSINEYELNLTVYPLTLKNENETYELVKSNQWIEKKEVSDNWLKRNKSLLV